MATENEVNDAKVRAWRALATLLETCNGIAAKLEKMADRELATHEGGAGGRGRS